MEAGHAIFKWLHIFAGVMWIGLLYFFNFINGPFGATMDGETKKKVVPELLPRTLYWFRWGAAWTWITGVLLIMLVFYHSRMVFNEDGDWNVATFVMIAVTFLGVFVYDALMKAMKGNMASIIIGLVLTGVILVGMSCWANFSYRGYNIHIGAMFGTIMAFNVWYRIWPAQQKIITAIKNGEAPPADLAALAGLRSKHNTYLSVPLFWTMINQHTTFFSGGNWGIPGHYAWAVLLVITVIGWHMVKICYKKGAKVRGF